MADSMNQSRFLNPWKLHLQKLGLELSCPLCLMVIDQPVLLPCNHIFCKTCITVSTQFDCECIVCKTSYSDQDLRDAPFMETILTVYRSMEKTLSASLNSSNPDASRVLHKQLMNSTPTDLALELPEEQVQIATAVNLSFGSSISLPVSNHEDTNEIKNFVQRLDGQEPEIHQLSSTMVLGGDKLDETLNLHQVIRYSSDSPPSFGDTKGSQEGSSGHRQECSPKRPAENMFNTRAVEEVGKRQKLDHSSVDATRQSHACSEAVVANFAETVAPSSRPESNPGEIPSDVLPPSLSSSSGDHETICAFCQSSNISQATGLMLHYMHGKPVTGDDARRPSVIHVHTKCIEWAPQVYFSGENAFNLEAELARGAKLKCSSCGHKGAALGCFAKTCRKTYHAPCAVEVSGCRWDCTEFLLLCPAHQSTKFPSERRVKGQTTKQPLLPPLKPEQAKIWDASRNGTKEWVICGSALSTEEKALLTKFAGISGITVSKLWKPDVTHVIAATDANGAYARTLKVLMAISLGKWILTIDWIKACMDAMCLVDEEPFEVSLDNHGSRDGPQTRRLRLQANEPKLFKDFHIYFTGNFISKYLRDLKMLVSAAGGSVLADKEEMLCNPSNALVVYNTDTFTQECRSGEENLVVLQRHGEAEALASESGARVTGHTWLLESIAAWTLQPLAT